MSQLPQRKKSAEEIARLRESIGVPPIPAEPVPTDPPPPANPTPPPQDLVDTIVPANHEATVVHSPETIPLSPAPALPPEAAAKPVHSLKRSERTPAPAPQAPATPPPPRPASVKPVRSLRKSEQAPPSSPAHHEPPPDSPLPHHRHSDREIQEIRRREALAVMNAPPNPKLFPAHPALIVPGYLTTAAAAAGFLFYEFHIAATSSLLAVSLAFAAWIFRRFPISRHHSAFIAVLTLLVLVFAALHYFPQLRHAS